MYFLQLKFILNHIFNKHKGSLLTKSFLQAEKLIARINDLLKDKIVNNRLKQILLSSLLAQSTFH